MQGLRPALKILFYNLKDLNTRGTKEIKPFELLSYPIAQRALILHPPIGLILIVIYFKF